MATRSAPGGWSPTPTPCQVLTIHRSKGLEFPIVYCPFLWDTIWRDDKVADPVVFHDDDDARKVDVALEGSLTLRTPRERTPRRTARSYASPTSR